ncbi:GNAT family N-acetyltransferase [Sphingomonas sp. CJ20]
MTTETITAPEHAGWADLETRSGFACRVRPVTPADQAALAEFFTHVTPDDLRFRFLTGIREVGAARIAEMTRAGSQQKQDFVVSAPGDDAIIANAVLAADAQNDTAEVAISIRQDLKGRGIGWALLDHVARYAKAQGIRTLLSIESRDNHAAIELEREMGFTARALDGDPTLVVLEVALQK